jgi:hydrophobic/amphiphilic exporter-1 (mainly G- bacteria), HAE1 family
LPTDLPQPPSFQKTNPNDQPIFYIALVSDTMTEGDLYDYGNTQLGQQIAIINGVSQVQVYGARSAIRIKVRINKFFGGGAGRLHRIVSTICVSGNEEQVV